MNFTLWTLGLAAVAAILFFGRRRWERKAETRLRDQAKRKSQAAQAEIDRLACLDLGKSLMASQPTSRPEGVETPVVAEKTD